MAASDPNQPLQRIAMLPHLALPLRRMFGLMAETLEIHTNHPAVLEIADQAFGRFPIHTPQNDPPLRMEVAVDETTEISLPTAGMPQPRFLYHQGWFTIQTGSLGYAVSDLPAGRAIVVASPALLTRESYFRYHFMEALGLSMLGLARQYFVLHAAFLEKNCKGIVILAESGMGKSSLAYSCLRRGYSLVTEDSLQVKALPDGDYALYGMPWKLHLLPDARRLFPELAQAEETLQINGERKLEIDIEKSFPGSVRTTAHPTALVFLERNKNNSVGNGAISHTHLSRLPSHIARQRLQVIWSWDIGWDDRHEQAVHNLLKLPAYCLAMNGSPEDAADALDELLHD